MLRGALLVTLLLGATIFSAITTAQAQGRRAVPTLQPSGAQHRTIVVDGVTREYLLYTNSGPAPATGAPLVLVFHGHGGTAGIYARWLGIHELWPEAVVVYLQGLPGVGVITDPSGRQSGWQINPGEQGDRDVRFVDATLAQLQVELAIDSYAIYALGHSNGARFVNVLWNERGETYAAFASASAQGGLLIANAVPRSLFMLMGEEDPLVPIAGQKLTIPIARRTLQTDPTQATTQGYLHREPGVLGTELAIYEHPGGHGIPPEAVPLMVDFFKSHPRPASTQAGRISASTALQIK